MKPFEIYSEAGLVGAGLDEDSTWDLTRALSAARELDIPDSFVVDTNSFVRLFELTGYDSARMVEYLTFIGRNCVNTDINAGSTDAVEVRSLMAAQFFDTELDNLAAQRTRASGVGIDSAKFASYEEFGIVEHHVPIDALPSTKSRMIRFLTTTAFLDGFRKDFDLSAVVKLINSDPVRVFNLSRDHDLHGRGLRIVCELIDATRLFPEELSQNYPDCSICTIKNVIEDAEIFIVLAASLMVSVGDLTEEELITKTQPIIEDFIEASINVGPQSRHLVTSQIIAKYYDPEAVVDLFRRIKNIGNPFRYTETIYKLLLPIHFDNSNTTVDRYWVISKMYEENPVF